MFLTVDQLWDGTLVQCVLHFNSWSIYACICVRVHVRVYMGVQVWYKHVCAEAGSWHQGPSSVARHLIFSNKGHLLTLKLASSVTGWPASLGNPIFVPSTGLRGTDFCMGGGYWKSELESSYLCDKDFPNWAIPLPVFIFFSTRLV